MVPWLGGAGLAVTGSFQHESFFQVVPEALETMDPQFFPNASEAVFPTPLVARKWELAVRLSHIGNESMSGFRLI
jgi:hypothetical protein